MDNLACTVAISSDFLAAFAAVPKHEQGKVVDFLSKFHNNPTSSGINYEKIHSASDPKFRSVRIDESYRGIVLKPDEGNVYLLLWVDRHDRAYDWARKKRCIINPSRGNIQIYDIEERPAAADPVEATSGTRTADQVISLPGYKSAGLFNDVDDDTMKKIGVPDELMTLIRGIRSQEELDAKARLLPHDVYEALSFIASGISPEEVLRELFGDEAPVFAKIDTGDFAAALDQPASKEKFMVLDGEEGEQELKEMLAAPLEKWRVFLHQSQRRMVEKNYNGPAQAFGGAGTGKTVVAMHRARWLAQNIFQSPDDRILFTTFAVNLAGDIRDNLKKICTPEIMNRIEVVNLDKWVSDFLKTQGYKYEIAYGERLNALWQEALAVAPMEPALPLSFYLEECKT
jgi:mRNA-degrading endonuclease RelE of RelBE toxin-antitoxin system